jgi:hypothetical protein
MIVFLLMINTTELEEEANAVKELLLPCDSLILSMNSVLLSSIHDTGDISAPQYLLHRRPVSSLISVILTVCLYVSRLMIELLLLEY